MLPKPSVDGWLIFVGLGYVTIWWWWWEQSHSPHSQKSKETKKGKDRSLQPFQGHIPMTWELPLGSFEVFHLFSNSIRVETKIVTHRLLGSIYFLTYSSTTRGSSTCLHVCVCRAARHLSGASLLRPCCAEQRDESPHWEHTCSETREKGLLRRESQPCPHPGDRRTRKPVSESLMRMRSYLGQKVPRSERSWLTLQVDMQQNWKYGDA